MLVLAFMLAAFFALCGGCGGGGSSNYWDDLNVGQVTPVCGNALKEAGEQCDDGNTTDNDGCSSECLIVEQVTSVCGNALKETGEQCDDGNTTDNDGCSSKCLIGMYTIYDSDKHENVVALDGDNNGEIVVIGNIQEQEDDRAMYDLFIGRIDIDGSDLSKTEYGKNECSEMPYSAMERENGGYLIGGHIFKCDKGNSNGWVLNMNSQGDVEWEWEKETTGNDYVVIYGIGETYDGGVIAGGSQRLDSELQDMYVVKLNESGVLEWEKAMGGDEVEILSDVLQRSGGDYFLLGQTSSYGHGLTDIWLVSLDHSGSIIWEQYIGTELSDYASDMSETSDGGIIIAGMSTYFSDGDNLDLYVLKTDSMGNQSWYYSWGGSGDERVRHIIQTSDNGYAVVGGTKSYGSGSSDMFIVKLDSDGKFEWSAVYGSSQYDIATYFIEISGGYIVAGETCGYMDVYCDVVLMKVDENGVCNGCPE